MMNKSTKNPLAVQVYCQNPHILINKPHKGFCRNCITPCLSAEGVCDICNYLIE